MKISHAQPVIILSMSKLHVSVYAEDWNYNSVHILSVLVFVLSNLIIIFRQSWFYKNSQFPAILHFKFAGCDVLYFKVDIGDALCIKTTGGDVLQFKIACGDMLYSWWRYVIFQDYWWQCVTFQDSWWSYVIFQDSGGHVLYF